MKTSMHIVISLLFTCMFVAAGAESAFADGTCQPMELIGCNAVSSASTVGLVNNISAYDCSIWDESGPEYVYSFVAHGNGQVTATLSGLSVDLDIFVLQGACGQHSCIAMDDSQATFNAVSGIEYYIVVDGYSGASGTFTLTVTCGWACEPMDTIACGNMYASSTVGLSNNISAYDCVIWNESGPEYVYSFVSNGNGSVTAVLSGLSADLDLFILEGTCSQYDCIAYGDDWAIFSVISGAHYYIVVDGYSGASGPYTLELTCTGSTCEEKLAGDVSQDCYVNFVDLALMANNWLKCNNDLDAGC